MKQIKLIVQIQNNNLNNHKQNNSKYNKFNNNKLKISQMKKKNLKNRINIKVKIIQCQIKYIAIMSKNNSIRKKNPKVIIINNKYYLNK